MKIDEYITNLRSKKNITIAVIDGNLKIKASKNDLTQEIVQDIKKRKSEILRFFDTVGKVSIPICPIGNQLDYPLSQAQRRLWVLDQLVDANGLYNVSMTSSFRNLNVSAFNDAVRALIHRHEILRTTIHMKEGEPRQRVHTIDEFGFGVIHRKADNEQLDQITHEELYFPLDLTVSPIRATLVECSDGTHEFIFIVHHIASDGWSMKVLKDDYLAFYNHYSSAVPLDLPDLQIQYKDYSNWQQEQIASGMLNKSRDYWLAKFSGELTGLNLPLDFPRKESKSYEGSGISFEIEAQTIHKLSELGNTNEASLFMVFVSIVKVLLCRYTGQNDIIIGTPVTGRNHQELNNQVGFYSNIVVVRSFIQHTENFIKALSEVRKNLLEAYENESFPYDMLVDELDLERDMSRNPLFDVMVIFNDSWDRGNSVAQPESVEGFSDADGGVNKFDLTFAFNRSADGTLAVNINYNSSLFQKAKGLRMGHHLKKLITEVLDNPQKEICQIDYLSEKERDQILKVFNDTAQAYSLDTSIKKLIERQADRTPKEQCLISEQGAVTFEEMNAVTNRMAHYLYEELELVPGDCIGVTMGGTVNRILTLISILKLGGAYVPLDPDYPRERLEYAIKDTKLKVLITDRSNDQNLNKESTHYTIVYVEEILDLSNDYSISNLDLDSGPKDTFAVLYTSGSTGQPKGVPIKNIGIINRMQWLWDTCNFTKKDIIYQKTPYVFDVSIGEIFMPLCFGAQLLIADSAYSQEIVKNIIKFKATYVHFSPTMLNKFLELNEDEVENISSLRYVFASGEALLKETVNRYYSKFKVPLLNLYGPTEASIEVSSYETKPGDQIIPIGKPISNVRLYILDGQYQLSPVGIPGEIGIAGIGLAPGYLNQPEKTNERFIEDVFYHEKGHQIYKTGDVGCWQEDGTIEFLGRKDNQVSINGSRIELGEIESRILEHPMVQEVTVVVNKDSFDNYHLMAYYVKSEPKDQNDALTTKAKQHTIGIRPHELSTDLTPRNGYKVEYQLHDLFSKAALKNSDRIALSFRGREMSYKTLDDKSNHLAKYIQTIQMLGPEDLVGIIMERSERMIVAILSVLKTGAAYVPIDPDYPISRIEYMLNDASVGLVLVDKQNEKTLVPDSVKKVFYDEAEREPVECNGVMKGSLHSGTPNDLCYVCYTSGSTGAPKGVMIEHRSVVDYVLTFIDYFNIERNDIVIQQSSLSFDTAVEEIFPVLCSGGKLIILPQGGRDIEAVIEAINENEATVLSTTPLVVNELNQRFENLRRVPRLLISGGDELRPAYIDRMVDKLELYNTYGPTEATVCAAFARIEDKSKCNVIGRPITNHEIYLVNEHMQPISNGEVGEMYIAGSGVGRGYINNEKETTHHFVNTSFEPDICYKTGDLARWNSEGMLEFCGRKDLQVKIRGYRVEPAEVSHTVMKKDGIRDAITVVKTDSDYDKHLVTYYTTSTEIDSEDVRIFMKDLVPHYMVSDYFVQLDEFPRNINGKVNIEDLPVPDLLTLDREFNLELKDFLKNKLPVYMIPSYFRNLDKLPLTPTGKVDRKSLEAKGLGTSKKHTKIIPTNHIEKVVLEIWENCLKQTSISTDSNFFEVGGNSLKATQIVAEIFRKLNQTVALKEVFNNPTIRELAQLITEQERDSSLLIKLNHITKHQPDIYFIPPIIGSSTIFKELVSALKTPVNGYGMQYRGFDFEDSFHNSIEEMANNFVSEINNSQNGNEVCILGYSMGVPIAFEMTKLLEAEGKRVTLILVDRGIPTEGGRQTTLAAKEQVDDLLERELKLWFTDISIKDTTRIKNLVFNNLRLLNKYQTVGKINSNIVAVEATKNLDSERMNDWQPYTNGHFKLCKVELDHYGMLDNQNVSILGGIIDEVYLERD